MKLQQGTYFEIVYYSNSKTSDKLLDILPKWSTDIKLLTEEITVPEKFKHILQLFFIDDMWFLDYLLVQDDEIYSIKDEREEELLLKPYQVKDILMRWFFYIYYDDNIPKKLKDLNDGEGRSYIYENLVKQIKKK